MAKPSRGRDDRGDDCDTILVGVYDATMSVSVPSIRSYSLYGYYSETQVDHSFVFSFVWSRTPSRDSSFRIVAASLGRTSTHPVKKSQVVGCREDVIMVPCALENSQDDQAMSDQESLDVE